MITILNFVYLKLFISFVFINQKIKTMKIEKNFTTGVLSGICGILVVLVIMGSTTPETTTKFEFHDLGDTRGVVFNKVTGEMEYKEIRTEPLPGPSLSVDNLSLSGTLWLESQYGLSD